MKSDNVDGFEEEAMGVTRVPRDAVITVSGEICVCCGAWIPEGMQVCPACSAILRGDEMSVKNGVWHDAQLDPPKDGKQVLCVKENRKGDRSLCFGSLHRGAGWVTGGGCNNVIYWMPLPEIPEK